MRNYMNECNVKFKELIVTCENIRDTNENLKKKIKDLQTKFQTLSNKEVSQLFVYSLDSVFFQFYVCNIQMEHFSKIFDLIQNHIYCDLFKLHRILCDYVENNIHEKKIVALLNVGMYPVYKDLEKYKVYDIDVVIALYENISNIITAVQECCRVGTLHFNQHKLSIENGFHYDKLLQTFQFNTKVVEEQVKLYYNFLKHSCNYHHEYLNKIHEKVAALYCEIPPLFVMGEKKTLNQSSRVGTNKETRDIGSDEETQPLVEKSRPKAISIVVNDSMSRAKNDIISLETDITPFSIQPTANVVQTHNIDPKYNDAVGGSSSYTGEENVVFTDNADNASLFDEDESNHDPEYGYGYEYEYEYDVEAGKKKDIGEAEITTNDPGSEIIASVVDEIINVSIEPTSVADLPLIVVDGESDSDQNHMEDDEPIVGSATSSQSSNDNGTTLSNRISRLKKKKRAH